MSQSSLSKSKSSRARKTVPLPDLEPKKKVAVRPSVAADTARLAASLRENCWTEVLQELLDRNKLKGTFEGQYLSIYLPKQSGDTPVLLDLKHIVAGAELLTEAIFSVLVQQRIKAPLALEKVDFARFYEALAHSVPESKRRPLLQGLRQGLDDVVRYMPGPAARDKAGGREYGRVAEYEPEPPREPNPAPPVSTADFMANLEQQAVAQRASDVNKGLLLSTGELASRLEVSVQALHHARKAKRMFALQGPRGDLVYPSFFADRKLDRKNLEAVSKALGDLPGAAKFEFFMAPRLSLDEMTPLEMLKKGKVEPVLAAARAFAEE